ncbi:hypothetical protein K2173_021485 [Erythroxylum novogranatense]|uniref:CRIB domain-containing protein n=1 Tax=Erythroxylum novogranatense TaxID=1862640 RepID=A0AAV8TN90_9ROSI|nr:hypothetical protein K2173_021485 [Erythroxylum novogranatense]
MSTKVKGLLKGLRYISQIFDEKEQELEIGLPTDVKHVAHIGMDGPDANKPSWMNEYKTEMSSGPLNSSEEAEADRSSNPRETGKKKHRLRRPSSTGDAPLESLTNRSFDTPKQSRRHRSSNNSMDSTNRDSGSVRSRDGGSTRSRRHQSSSAGGGGESPATDQPSIPKHSRVRKSKGSSSKQSRSKDHNLPADPHASMVIASQGSQTAGHLSSVLEAYAAGEK